MNRVTRENLKLVREYLNVQGELKGFTPDTDYTYGRAHLALVDFIPKPFHQMTEAELERFIARPLDIRRQDKPAGSPPSPGTKRRRASEVRGLFAWLYKRGYIPSNVAAEITVPTVDNEKPNPIRVELWCELWASNLTDNDRVGFGLGEFCGLRRQEITRLGRQHVDGGELEGFWRKGDKPGLTKYKGHSPWLSNLRLFMEHSPEMLGSDIDSFLDPFERVLRARRGGLLLDGWLGDMRRTPSRSTVDFIRPAYVNDRMILHLGNLGHDIGAATPHMLRHRFVSFLVNAAKMPIHEARVLANHRSVETTQRYVEVDRDPGAKYRPEQDDDKLLERFSRRS